MRNKKNQMRRVWRRKINVDCKGKISGFDEKCLMRKVDFKIFNNFDF